MIEIEEPPAAARSIREAAQKLAGYNLEAAEIVPYHFGAAPKSGIPYRSSIALIRPNEAFRLSPPPGWGSWEDAVKLWPWNERVLASA